MEPAQETVSGQEGLEQTMPTSLQGRAKQAAHDKSYRLRHRFGMLTVASVRSGWPLLNKRAASGVDRISARAYGSRLHDHVTALVERVKNQCYRAKLVRRHSIPKGNGALRPLGIPMSHAYCTPSNALWVSTRGQAGGPAYSEYTPNPFPSASAAVCVAGPVCVRP